MNECSHRLDGGGAYVCNLAPCRPFLPSELICEGCQAEWSEGCAPEILPPAVAARLCGIAGSGQQAAGSDPSPVSRLPTPDSFRFGDRIASALDAVGVTKERVEAWVGGPCGCLERQERLNRLGAWAHAFGASAISAARSALESMLAE